MNDLKLVRVDPRIISSYSEKPLAQIAEIGIATEDVAADLLALCLELPWLRITELHRSVATQEAARAKYVRWLNAGKPRPGTSGFDKQTMKADYVAKPGKSMHNAGRAIDVWVDKLKEHLGPDYLDVFWPIAVKYGFVPVIAEPVEGATECWHFDHRGPWQTVKDHYGYEVMATCAAVVVGNAGNDQTVDRTIQALLLRAGYDIGEPDGVIGKVTKKGLEMALGMLYDPLGKLKTVDQLKALPAATVWKKVVA